jgi:hypothetical protein
MGAFVMEPAVRPSSLWCVRNWPAWCARLPSRWIWQVNQFVKSLLCGLGASRVRCGHGGGLFGPS